LTIFLSSASIQVSLLHWTLHQPAQSDHRSAPAAHVGKAFSSSHFKPAFTGSSPGERTSKRLTPTQRFAALTGNRRRAGVLCSARRSVPGQSLFAEVSVDLPARTCSPAKLPRTVSTRRLPLTCFKACSRRVCLDTDSLHTVSHRLLSSCSCTFTQVVSSRLFSMSSRPERLSTWTVPVRFPSSFWKTWMEKGQKPSGASQSQWVVSCGK